MLESLVRRMLKLGVSAKDVFVFEVTPAQAGRHLHTNQHCVPVPSVAAMCHHALIAQPAPPSPPQDDGSRQAGASPRLASFCKSEGAKTPLCRASLVRLLSM